MSAIRDAAVARVIRLGATGLRPAISDGDVGSIVDAHKVYDAEGRFPGADGYVETYDTNAALAEVWRQKAAQVAGDFDFRADDAEFSKGDVLAHMLAMEAKYGAAALPPLPNGPAGSTLGTIQVGGTNSGLVNPLDRLARQVIP